LTDKKIDINTEIRNLKDKAYVNLKDIGSLKEKVLLFLGEHSKMNAQAIQKELGYPPDQYPNILKAVKVLEKLELVKSENGTSAKNVPMRLYSCSDEGIFYVLTKNPNANFLEIFKEYENQSVIVKNLKTLYGLWGQETFSGFLRNISEFLPMILKEGVEAAMPYMVLKVYAEIHNQDYGKRKKFAAQTMKEFPEVKKFMKEWKKNLDELL